MTPAASPPGLPATWIEARAALARALRLSLAAAGRIGEGERRHVDERLAQCVWFDRLLRSAALQTASGKALEILDPGRWNTAAGPDFLGATLRLAGEEFRGDVEIHVESAEWARHGHDSDPAYNACRLHAFLWASDDRPYDTLADGRRLERFEMAPALEPDLETLRRTLNPEEYPHGRPAAPGLCHRQLLALGEPFIERLLDLAGRERLLGKARRLEGQSAGESRDQVFYQALMIAQGHKSSKTLYFLLSKRARLEELLDVTRDRAPGGGGGSAGAGAVAQRALAIHAILLHIAGLAGAADETPDEIRLSESGNEEEGAREDSIGESDSLMAPGSERDEETRQRLAAMRRVWAAAAPYFSDRLIPPSRRWFRGARPANFPARRLAGIAWLIARHASARGDFTAPFLEALREIERYPPRRPAEIRRAVSRLAALFTVEEPEDYWAWRFTPGGKKLARPLALIGEAAARSLTFNVLLPFGIFVARGEEDPRFESAIFDFAARFPDLPPNEVTRFMSGRLFGEAPGARRWLRGELRRQALFHMYADCCNSNEKTCADCLLLSLE